VPEVVIVDAVRSPIGRAFKGSLIAERGDDLLVQLVQSIFDRAPELDPATIDEVIVGCGLAGGEQGGNLGRILAVLLGLDSVPGYTLNKYCASSMQSTRAASHAIAAGDGDIFLSLGVEMVSRLAERNPDPTPSERNPVFNASAPSPGPWSDPRARGIIPDIFMSMGETAENVADISGVTRAEMDDFAFRSQALAAEGEGNGFWEKDITPVRRADGRLLDTDDSPRASTTREGLAQLEPVFRPDGRVTAGNCCPLNDGAAAILLMSDRRAKALGLRPRARVVSSASSALSPEIMGLGTVDAGRKALYTAGLSVDDIDLIEINEAFAAQAIPTYRKLGFPLEKVNVRGGAIALGHPFGMSGARITTTLLNSLEAADKRYGLQTMCVAGGQGMAMVIERLDG
jgi:acetyl-CoA C-acetyltransferase